MEESLDYLGFFKIAFHRNMELIEEETNPKNLQILIKNVKDIKESLEGRLQSVKPAQTPQQLTIKILGADNNAELVCE